MKRLFYTLSHPYIGISVLFLIGLTKLILGYALSSYWLMITAIYYIILSVARGYLTHCYKDDEKYGSQKGQYLIYKKSGYFIIFLSISYFISCICMYEFNQMIIYPGYILYGVVAFAFYKIINAIIGIVNVRKQQNLVLSSIKIMMLIDACVSIVASQCALLTMQASSVAASSSAILGIVCSIVFIGIGFYMLKKSMKQINFIVET